MKTKKVKNKFSTYYKKLPYIERLNLKRKIIKELQISETKFYSWLSGRTKIPPYALKYIALLINKPESFFLETDF